MLTFDRVLIGSMGRPIKPLETAGFKRVVGAEPVEIRAAHAANDTSQHLATSLAVYVHRDNPITQLTTKQVAQILSVGRQLKRLENEPGGITVAAIGRETALIKQVAIADAPEGPFIKGTSSPVVPYSS
jgi:hypothetical protein